MQNIENTKISGIETLPQLELEKNVVRIQRAVRIGEVDTERTIELVMLAKGPRSLRQFAKVLGVNVSSLSRIINGRVMELRATLLAGIAFHADPNSGVTIDQLMEAQGLTDLENRVITAKRYEQECRGILADELLKRGYTVKYVVNLLQESGSNRMMYDFEVMTNALGTEGSTWMVECKMMSHYSALPVGVGKSQIWMDAAMGFYYRGGKAGRISLVIDRREIFEQLKERLSKCVIPDEISIILMSVQKRKILDEYVAPLTGGRVPSKIFGTTEDNNRI